MLSSGNLVDLLGKGKNIHSNLRLRSVARDKNNLGDKNITRSTVENISFLP